VGAPLSVIANLMEIAEAHEVGDREAERNAFIHGFASHLVYGHIFNPLPSNTILGHKQILGELAAKRFLAEMPGNVRAKFLTTFWCKIELREANPAHSQAGRQPLNAGFCALPLIRQTRVNGARHSYGLQCQVTADVD